MVLNKDEALMRLRFRSAPLQGDDCSHIQGKHVLCIHKSPFKSHFYDAKVEKVLICILIYIQLPWNTYHHKIYLFIKQIFFFSQGAIGITLGTYSLRNLLYFACLVNSCKKKEVRSFVNSIMLQLVIMYYSPQLNL